MLIKVEGNLAKGVTGKDIVLAIIGKIGTAGGTGYTIEFAGSAIRSLSMEGRMTVCNMAIEGGARAGLVAVDEKTIDYVKGRLLSPTGVEWDHAVAYWKTLQSDPGAHFDTWSNSTPAPSCRKSLGAPRPKWCWASTAKPPTGQRKRRRQA